jgi:hypothetical protein
MPRSTSSLSIDWTFPELSGEEWEFFHHPAKQPFYLHHRIDWETLGAAFAAGSLVPYPRSGELGGVPVALSHHSYDDYARYLAKAKRGYRLNYNRMEDALQRQGHLTLPAPVILQAGGEALLFSGYRRLCLAWNYGMVPFVWLVTLHDRVQER